MAQISDSEFIDKLREFQRGSVDLLSFQQWIELHYDQLTPLVAPGALLKLRRGDKQKALKAVGQLLPSCPDCAQLCEGRVFSSREEHGVCAARVEDSLRAGTLKRIQRPDWFHPSELHFGADGYFECTMCGTIWTLVEPEREDNGLWERLT